MVQEEGEPNFALELASYQPKTHYAAKMSLLTDERVAPSFGVPIICPPLLSNLHAVMHKQRDI